MVAPTSAGASELGVRNMATEQEQYTPDSDDEMDTSGDEMDEISVTLTPQEWKAKAGDLYKVSAFPGLSFGSAVCQQGVCLEPSLATPFRCCAGWR